MSATDKRVGYPSLYKAAYEDGWELKNLGYDYSDTLLKRSMSNYMFRNPNLSTFLQDYLNPIMVFFLNRVKFLRIYYNYGVPKDYEKIN
jgi:hypothetical protein